MPRVGIVLQGGFVLTALRETQRKHNRAATAAEIDDVLGPEKQALHIHTEAVLRHLIWQRDVRRGMEPGTYLAL